MNNYACGCYHSFKKVLDDEGLEQISQQIYHRIKNIKNC